MYAEAKSCAAQPREEHPLLVTFHFLLDEEACNIANGAVVVTCKFDLTAPHQCLGADATALEILSLQSHSLADTRRRLYRLGHYIWICERDGANSSRGCAVLLLPKQKRSLDAVGRGLHHCRNRVPDQHAGGLSTNRVGAQREPVFGLSDLD